MTLLIILLIVVLLYLLTSSSALSHYSLSRLEKAFGVKHSSRLDMIRRWDEEADAALRAWTWLAAVALVVALVVEGFAGPDFLTAKDSSSVELFPKLFAFMRWSALVGFSILFTELVLARPVGRVLADGIVFWTWPALSVIRTSAWPFVRLEAAATAFFRVLVGMPTEDSASAIQDELLSVVTEGEREGSIHGDAADIIEQVMDLHEVEVAEIMTPRTDMTMLKANSSLHDACKLIVEEGHSRIPVYGESRDEIVGIVYAKDLLPHFLNGAGDHLSVPLTSLSLREPIYVPLTKPVNILLREFQLGRVHMAIVLDEYGGVAGLVTIEDVLEEIVGDISDEHDPTEAPPIVKLENNQLEVDARVHLEELNEAANLELPDNQDFDTLGGFIFNSLGRIPKSGEAFELDGLRFVILSASDRQINRVRIEALVPSSNVGQPQQTSS